MQSIVIAWLATGVTFALADFIWLSLMVPRLHRPIIGSLLTDRPDFGAMIAFYVIYISGVVFFAVSPALSVVTFQKALLNGAVLGFIAYATFDLSNQAIMKAWALRLSVIDIGWGTVATALAAGVGYLVATRFG